jgi:hypothetical protein
MIFFNRWSEFQCFWATTIRGRFSLCPAQFHRLSPVFLYLNYLLRCSAVSPSTMCISFCVEGGESSACIQGFCGSCVYTPFVDPNTLCIILIRYYPLVFLIRYVSCIFVNKKKRPIGRSVICAISKTAQTFVEIT